MFRTISATGRCSITALQAGSRLHPHSSISCGGVVVRILFAEFTLFTFEAIAA
jgi:hypothetical protein